MNDERMRDDVSAFINDLAIYRPTPKALFQCVALKGDREVIIPEFPTKPVKQSSTTHAAEMIAVDILVGPYPVQGTVDTGNGWPMSVPKTYGDAVIRDHLATKAGASSTTLWDGSTREVSVIMIDSITVEGWTLHDVEASVSSNDEAPVLLGLPALSRLGRFTITDGKLAFTEPQRPRGRPKLTKRSSDDRRRRPTLWV